MMNNTNKHSFLLVAAMLLIALLTGCLKDDLSDCPRPFQLTVKALDADSNDITELGDVEQVVLFVFDENDKIYQTFTLSGEDVKRRKHSNLHVDFPASKKFRVIALGNLDDKVDYSDIHNVNELADLYIRLKSTGPRILARNIAQSPGDIFGGEIEVGTQFGGIEGGEIHVVEISRLTVGITITAIDLIKWNGGKQGDYTFIVNETYNMLSSDWNMIGDRVSYAPQSLLVEEANLFAPIFYSFPVEPGEGYVVQILYNGEVIYIADKDTDGVKFYCEMGRTLNIIIDFRANLHIMAEITPWNVVFQYVDFN